MFYKLNCCSLLNKGINEGCIINLSNNELFKLNKQEQDIIEVLEKGEKVEQFGEDILPLLDQLTKEGYGEYGEKPVIFEKFRIGLQTDTPGNTKLFGLYINLTTECNMNCYYCNEDNQVRKRTGCKKWRISSEKLSFDHYRKVIAQAHRLGCMSVKILGGEPFLEKELLFQITEFIRSSTDIKDINIATNGYLLDDVISDIKNETLVINAIAHNQQLLNQIDMGENSLDILKHNLAKIRENNINYIIHLVISKENYKNINDILDFHMAKNAKEYTFDYIYDDSDDNYLKFYLQQIGNEVRKDFNELRATYYKDYHPCLNGVLSLFPDGTIGVCPMMKDEAIGNIKENTLYELFEKDAHKKYWEMPLSIMEKCERCCYQLICKDCRAMDKSITGNLYEKHICPKDYI